jgi:hypothetical protein
MLSSYNLHILEWLICSFIEKSTKFPSISKQHVAQSSAILTIGHMTTLSHDRIGDLYNGHNSFKSLKNSINLFMNHHSYSSLHYIIHVIFPVKSTAFIFKEIFLFVHVNAIKKRSISHFYGFQWIILEQECKIVHVNGNIQESSRSHWLK